MYFQTLVNILDNVIKSFNKNKYLLYFLHKYHTNKNLSVIKFYYINNDLY